MTRRNPTEPEWHGLYAYGWKATYSKDEEESRKGVSLLQKFLVRLEEDPEPGSETYKRKILKRLAEVLAKREHFVAAAGYWRKYEESLPSNMKKLERPSWYVKVLKESTGATSSRPPRRYIHNPRARRNAKAGEHPTVRYAQIMRIIEDPRTNEGYRVTAVNAKTKMEAKYPELNLVVWYRGFQQTKDYVPPPRAAEPKAEAPKPAPPPPPPKPQPHKRFKAAWLNTIFDAAEKAASYYGSTTVKLGHLLESALILNEVKEALTDFGESWTQTLDRVQTMNQRNSEGRFTGPVSWSESVSGVRDVLLGHETYTFTTPADEYDLIAAIGSAGRTFGGNVLPISLMTPARARTIGIRRERESERAAQAEKLRKDEEASQARAADLRAKREKLRSDRSGGSRHERHWRAWNYGDSKKQQAEMVQWMEEPGSADEPGYLKWDDNLSSVSDDVWHGHLNIVASSIPTPEGREARADLWSIAPSPKIFRKKNMIQCSALQAILLLSLLNRPLSWGVARKFA